MAQINFNSSANIGYHSPNNLAYQQPMMYPSNMPTPIQNQKPVGTNDNSGNMANYNNAKSINEIKQSQYQPSPPFYQSSTNGPSYQTTEQPHDQRGPYQNGTMHNSHPLPPHPPPNSNLPYAASPVSGGPKMLGVPTLPNNSAPAGGSNLIDHNDTDDQTLSRAFDNVDLNNSHPTSANNSFNDYNQGGDAWNKQQRPPVNTGPSNHSMAPPGPNYNAGPVFTSSQPPMNNGLSPSKGLAPFQSNFNPVDGHGPRQFGAGESGIRGDAPFYANNYGSSNAPFPPPGLQYGNTPTQGPPVSPQVTQTGYLHPPSAVSNAYGTAPSFQSPPNNASFPPIPASNMPNQQQYNNVMTTNNANGPSMYYPSHGQQQPYGGPQAFDQGGPMGHPPPTPFSPYTQQPMGMSMGHSPMAPMGFSPQGSGMGMMGSGMPPGMGMGPPGPNPVKKLDPDSLPNPIQVLDEDKKTKSGLYRCEENKDTLPPMVTTDFIADNNVNSSPRFIRSTLYCAPCSQDIIKSSAIPLALTISPFAKMHPSESPLPIIDFGDMGPVRCNRCKAYMCSFMQFNDGGRKFYCPFCKTNTEVPPEYFNHLDYNGKRIDLPQRPELFCGSFEMLATKEYCKNNEPPKPPALIFLFDVSYNAMHSGLVPHICANIKTLLYSLKGGEEDLGDKLKIGIITYDQTIHFYLAKDPEHPKIVFLPDLTEVFVPSDTEFLLTLDQMVQSIDCITDQILANFHDTKLTEVILGPAIQASLEALKQSNSPGKLIIFHTSLPNMEAPGKLENKDDPKLLGTEKEKNILLPNSPFYTKLGETCIQSGCGIDLFLFPNSYINLASIGEICRVTGGHVYKYDNFRAETDGERLVSHVEEVLKRPLAFDAIMKVRTSTGLRPVEYFGNFYMENSTDVEVAIMDSENSITVELKHDDKLSEQENLYIQVAILYTTMCGQRRLRIHNLSMRSSNQYTDIFRMCDLDALVNLLTKQAVRGVFTSTLKQVKEGLSRQCAQILACYRKQCATSSASGQLILPECMKLLPLYISCLLKSDALLGGVSIKTDDRNWVLFVVRNMSVLDSNLYVYPRLIPLHNLNQNDNETDQSTIPEMVRCSASKLEKHGVYLLDNGLSLYLWIGSLVNQEFLQEVFGITLISQIDVNKTLPHLNTLLSKRIRSIITKFQRDAYLHPKLTIVRESDPQANWVKRLLLEDASMVCAEMPSYVDFLCHIHKEIRSMLDA